MKNLKIDFTNVKKSIICKNVNSTLVNNEIKKTYIPEAGDVAIFKVIELGKHTRILTVNGSLIYILPGDFIMATFGNRYATEQLEGYIPDSYQDTYHILGQGGAIGVLASLHEKFEDVGPTTLELVGYVVEEENRVINTKYLKYEDFTNNHLQIYSSNKIILSLGTSMDSGKTTSAAFLARGLNLAGKRVAFIKLTGTVHPKDKEMVLDYGAKLSIDFSDFGFPSTFLCPTDEILSLFERLLNRIKSISPDYIIVEVADGLLQKETNALIHEPRFRKKVSGVIFSSGDSMSAIAGANMLSGLGYNVLGLTGIFTRSPLLMKEVQKESGYTVLNGESLMSKNIWETVEQKLRYEHTEMEMESAV